MVVRERVDEVECIPLMSKRKRLVVDYVEVEMTERTNRPNERLPTNDLG